MKIEQNQEVNLRRKNKNMHLASLI